ncbi:MAG: hypothetical protein IPN94_06105 [Sphingobacteriales bacterium]|jgi:hypothetical protein|nr:hypothetical protein [Sphingobacteriales bacterium]
MSNIINIYSSDKRIIGQVDLETKSIQIDQKNQTQETLPQAYAIHFLISNFDTEIVKSGILRFNGLINLSLLIARQVIIQRGSAGSLKFQNQKHERLTDNEYITILTNHFLSRENFLQ